MDELLINGENAYTTWGVRMGEGFLDVIGASASMKDFIENKSRLEHGKRVIINNPKVDEREITLSFTIESNSQSDYQAKKKAFFDELYKGVVDIQIPAKTELSEKFQPSLTSQIRQTEANSRHWFYCRVCECSKLGTLFFIPEL